MKQIPLTKNKFAIIDDEDFENLSKYKWYANKHGRSYYVIRNKPIGNGKQKTEYIHNYILNCPDGFEIDHKDGNGLNNQKSNLRISTHNQNIMNMKPHLNKLVEFKGVDLYKKNNKYRVRITINGKTIALGYFKDKIKAAETYDEKALELFGEFAHLNFPERKQLCQNL